MRIISLIDKPVYPIKLVWVMLLVLSIFQCSGCCNRLLVPFISDKACLSMQLFPACAIGDLATVEKLLNIGADINVQEVEGETPLMYAAANGRVEVVKYLIKRGADIHRKSNNNQTALGRATAFGRVEVVRVLLENNANVEESMNQGGRPLMYTDNIAIVKMLINKGANINAQDGAGVTALMAASANGRDDIVKELIYNGADINLKDKQGRTPLMWATERGHKSIIYILQHAETNMKKQ